MGSYNISGIDVSRHQGTVDFEAVAEAGQRFAIVKATEGCDYTDPAFVRNWEALLDLDGRIYRGAYHFARPDSTGGELDGKAEAEDFCDALQALGGYMQGCLPPALDFEKYSESDAKDNVPWIRAFIQTVEDRLGREPMIYTGANIWRYEVGNSDAFTDYPLWLVYYTAQPYPTKPMDSLPWEDFTFWQWSGGGDYAHGDPVPGIPGSGVCDLNWFAGSEEDLAELALVEQDHPLPDAAKIQALLAASEASIEDGLTALRVARRMLLQSS